jgi:hypothetical protein
VFTAKIVSPLDLFGGKNGKTPGVARGFSFFHC